MSLPGLIVVGLILATLAVPGAAAQQFSISNAAETVLVPNGNLRLTGMLWKPEGEGPFPAILFTHGAGRKDSDNVQGIGPIFAKHGYMFLYLFRRGHGLSADQGAFIGDLLAREASAKGEEARKRLQLLLLTTDHLDDFLAGLYFLRNVPDVNSGRIAVAGHSFGGQLALLAAEREPAVQAVVTFAAGAQLWDGSSELRERLLQAVRNIEAPVLLIHAANDFSTAPGTALAAEMALLKKPYQLKIYPAVGDTPSAGHNAVYTDIATWEADVFTFLQMKLR